MKKPENLLTIPGIKSFCLGIVVSAALFLPSQASADDISLNLKNVTVKRAIAALQQSHYSLTVDASQIDMERRITVAAEDEPIENVLAQIFAGQDVSYEINGRSIVVTRRAVPTSTAAIRCACRRTIPCCRFRSWATGRPKWRSHRRRRSWT